METQIIELEKKYWKAMEAHDYKTVKSLTRFPCIVAGKSGVRNVDESTFKKMFDSGDGNKIKIVNKSRIETQVLNENTAAIAYIIELSMANNEQKSPTKCVCTSTWMKENNKWLCVLHTETELVEQ